MNFCLQKVSIKDNLLTAVIHVIVFRSDIVDINRAENRYCCETFIDNSFSSNYFICALLDPFHKNFALDKRILRHLTDRFASRTEVLG